MTRRIFVTGGTGQLGTRLVPRLLGRGDQVVVLTRRPAQAREALGEKVELVEGDPTHAGTWAEQLDSCEAVIHLAGENVFARRWNTAFKQQLVDSRVLSTRHIAAALLRSPRTATGRPKVLVNASAIGIYGPRGDEEVTEETPPGDDFLARLCVEWEKEAREVESAGVRSVQVRVGVVLDQRAGALRKMLTPFRLFVGGPVGSGRQFVAWVHHEDMTRLLLFALDSPSCSGPINATAPHPVTNRQLGRALGQALGRPSFVWAPGFMLRLLLGEVATLVTTGQRVVPKKALALGHGFEYPTIERALAEIVAS